MRCVYIKAWLNSPPYNENQSPLNETQHPTVIGLSSPENTLRSGFNDDHSKKTLLSWTVKFCLLLRSNASWCLSHLLNSRSELIFTKEGWSQPKPVGLFLWFVNTRDDDLRVCRGVGWFHTDILWPFSFCLPRAKIAAVYHICLDLLPFEYDC